MQVPTDLEGIAAIVYVIVVAIGGVPAVKKVWPLAVRLVKAVERIADALEGKGKEKS